MATKKFFKLLSITLCLFIYFINKNSYANDWLIGEYGTFQGLDKITARIKTFDIEVGLTKRFGVLDISLEKCVYSKPLDKPESIAFVKVLDQSEKQLNIVNKTSIFEGWIFASSPALNAMEHPVYDVSLISCKKFKTFSNRSSSSTLRD